MVETTELSIKPNFFIVGAPKCGTTALYDYLSPHPDVFMPTLKEPKFFASDLDSGTEWEGRYFVRDEKTYLALFADARMKRRIGEASAVYLSSEVAAKKIKEFSPAAKIIVMLRNPVEMMYALHNQRVFDGYEDINNFEEALDAEEDRKQGRRLPARPANIKALFYRDMARYAGQVERFLDAFGRERVHIIIFDDFKSDVAASYRSTLNFLELDERFRPDFKISNASKRIRSRALQRLLQSRPLRGQLLGSGVFPADLRQKAIKRFRRINTKFEPRPPMSAGLRKRLQEEFVPEVERLSELLGRDLTHWCR
jgi:hypothetical protein